MELFVFKTFLSLHDIVGKKTVNNVPRQSKLYKHGFRALSVRVRTTSNHQTERRLLSARRHAQLQR